MQQGHTSHHVIGELLSFLVPIAPSIPTQNTLDNVINVAISGEVFQFHNRSK